MSDRFSACQISRRKLKPLTKVLNRFGKRDSEQAAGICSEIGDPFIQRAAANLASYAGVVRLVKQSGCPESEPRVGSVSKRNNYILKDYLLQASNHIGRHGPDDLKQDFQRRKCQGQNAEFGMPYD